MRARRAGWEIPLEADGTGARSLRSRRLAAVRSIERPRQCIQPLFGTGHLYSRRGMEHRGAAETIANARDKQQCPAFLVA